MKNVGTVLLEVGQGHEEACVDYVVHGNRQARILEWVAVPFPGDLPSPGIEPSSALQADSLLLSPYLSKNIAGEHYIHTSKVRRVMDGKPGPCV